MSDKLCNMCGETTNADLTGESGGSEDGLIDAKVHGGYYSPALRDTSMYKFSFCEYCLDHIFQQCVNPPKGWEYCFIDYQPIEEQLKDEKYKRGELYSYQQKVLEEKKRRDKLRANAKPYKSTSKEMLDYEKSWHSFGNSETAPTKEYQEKMKALRDETVRLFNLLTEEEKQKLIYERSSYPFTKQVPPEQWWNDSVPSDEKLVSQETHDAYEEFCKLVDSVDFRHDDVEYEAKKIAHNKKVQEAFDLLSPETKKVAQGLYNVVFEVRDPVWDAMWKKLEEDLPKDKIVMLSPRPEYPLVDDVDKFLGEKFDVLDFEKVSITEEDLSLQKDQEAYEKSLEEGFWTYEQYMGWEPYPSDEQEPRTLDEYILQTNFDPEKFIENK